MLLMLTPQSTYIALLIVQALYLLHHRLAKRHISFAEVISAIVLCVPPWVASPGLPADGGAPQLNHRADRRKLLDKKALAELVKIVQRPAVSRG